MNTCPFCASSLAINATTCPSCGAVVGGLQLAVGTRLERDQYVIERVLGQGGFGITYQAKDTKLGRQVAIKELFPEGSSRQGLNLVPPPSLGANGFTETRNRFLDEGRTLARFNHPGVVRVFDTFEQHGTAHLVMEALRKQSQIEEIIKRLSDFI